jgi:vesicle-fusing ATPase
MRNNELLDTDVDLGELASLTKNYSGAEISGLVKSASSFAFNRHVKVGSLASVNDDIENLKVCRADFLHALDEVRPSFGVSENEMKGCVLNGIIHYSPIVNVWINLAIVVISIVMHLIVLFHDHFNFNCIAYIE